MPDMSGCGGKPVFWKPDQDFFLFYYNVSQMWMVGNKACSDGEVMRVIDDAYSPDSITGDWREKELNKPSDWLINYNIKVTCEGEKILNLQLEIIK